MTSDDLTTTGESDWPISNPWPLLGYGLSATLLAVIVSESLPKNDWPLLRVFLIGTGMIASGGAVSIRARSTLVLFLAFLTGLFAYLAMGNTDWDSAQMAVGVLTTVAFLGTLVSGLAYCIGLMVPNKGKPVFFGILVSLLIVLHFGGILSAVTLIPPPSGLAPWIPNQLWTRFYRPYLQFCHANNAYHFYSPEPGPPTLFWALIEYADGSKRWITIPNRAADDKGFLEYADGNKRVITVPNRDAHDKDPLHQEWFRRLSLTESTNQLQALPMIPPVFRENRLLAGQRFRAGEIPLHPYLPEIQQFRVPQHMSLWMVPSYARHMARHYPHPIDPSIDFKSVKIYRVVHSMLDALQFNREDLVPTSPVLYFPYYHGEFDKDGNMLNKEDPFLYWLIPIVPYYENPSPAAQPLRVPVLQDPNKMKLRGYFDYLSRHAGTRVSPWGEVQEQEVQP